MLLFVCRRTFQIKFQCYIYIHSYIAPLVSRNLTVGCIVINMCRLKGPAFHSCGASPLPLFNLAPSSDSSLPFSLHMRYMTAHVRSLTNFPCSCRRFWWEKDPNGCSKEDERGRGVHERQLFWAKIYILSPRACGAAEHGQPVVV